MTNQPTPADHLQAFLATLEPEKMTPEYRVQMAGRIVAQVINKLGVSFMPWIKTFNTGQQEAGVDIVPNANHDI